MATPSPLVGPFAPPRVDDLPCTASRYPLPHRDTMAPAAALTSADTSPTPAPPRQRAVPRPAPPTTSAATGGIPRPPASAAKLEPSTPHAADHQPPGCPPASTAPPPRQPWLTPPTALPTGASDRRTTLTAYYRGRAERPLPSGARTPPPTAGGPGPLLGTAISAQLRGSLAAWGAHRTGAPSAPTARLARARTAELEASMASLRARASDLSTTMVSLIQQSSGLLTSLHGTQQSVTALASTPSLRTSTVTARVLQATLARTGPTQPS